jgi:DNA transposition AAA+ family ATPase
MKNLHEQFSSVDLLTYLYTKIDLLFHTQLYTITALEAALKRSRMIGILGREGMGKSSAIAKFIQESPSVYYVRIGQSYRISNFVDEMIFQVSGVYPKAPETLFIKVKQLSSLLAKDSTKKLIIVDDAGKLSPRGLGFFHELRDNTMQCTGFAFVGVDYFQKHLLQANKRGVTGVAEFYRRIQSWYTIPGLKKNEIAEYGRKQGLNDDQVLELLESGVETIAELEIMALKIKEEAEDAEKENRATKKLNVSVKPVQVSEDDENEELEDELEEIEATQRKKEKKEKEKKATKLTSSF